MAKAIGIGGVFIKSANPRKLARWYSRALGFDLMQPTAAAFAPASMPKGAVTVWSAFRASARYFAPSAAGHMINFLVDDVDGVLAQVAAAGGRQVGRVRSFPYGRFGWFLDPDGNKIELWEPVAPRRRTKRAR